MKTIPHRELRNNSSAVLRDVENGESIAISNHGKVVAMLTPANQATVPQLRVREAVSSAPFAQLTGVSIAESSQSILDELRGER